MYTGLLICAVVALLVLGLVLLARVERAAFRGPSSSAPDASDVTGPGPAGDERPPLLGDAGASAEVELLGPLALDEPATSPIETPGNGAAPLLAEGPRPSLIILERPRATRHPIVLAHGYFGFDRIGVGQLRQEYFRGVRARLEALGYSVIVTRVAPVGGVGRRAAQLARQIASLGAQRVHIIAHSMGGLDARLAIARFGLGERVASLTTIGTPHHGTPLADMVLTFGEWRRLRLLLQSIGVHIDGLYDVSTRRMGEFNRAVVDCPNVVYSSVVGAVSHDAVAAVNAVLSPAHQYLLRKVGANDGIVPAASQRWGEAVGEVVADHWAQIGWFGSFDVEGFYTRLAEGLAAREL
jgi:triacylglycerol lipase